MSFYSSSNIVVSNVTLYSIPGESAVLMLATAFGGQLAEIIRSRIHRRVVP
jgi:hypothetical protein